MKPSVVKRLVRFDRRFAVAIAVAIAAALVAAAPFALAPLPAMACAGLALLVFAALGSRVAVRLKRVRRDIAAKQAAAAHLQDLVRNAPATETGDDHRIRRVHEALAGGFPDSAVEEARTVASLTKIPVADRLALLRSVAAWQLDDDRSRPSETGRSVFDIVFVSHFGLPGGTTSANVAEIEICRENGLKVGLLHHPVYAWHPNAPLNPRIEEVIDGGSVNLIGLDEEVECELAIVRLPIVLMKPLERRPKVTAAHTAVLINQTPFKFYGEEGPREQAWDIATAARHVTDWLGPATWYAGGPRVLATLTEHHAEEIAELDLAPAPWNEVIAVDEWRTDRRVPDGRIRIGRHSRDHKLKWPEDRRTMLQCYPDRDRFEIHVLGGAETPTRILEHLPANWTVYPFGSLSAKDFLAQIDVMAYFIASDGMEAFGRAPLEAMAAGVPVIMDRQFEPTFGPAAIYCEPAEVASVAERLTSDPDAYSAQQTRAWNHLAQHFSGKALVERLSRCAPTGNLRERVECPPHLP